MGIQSIYLTVCDSLGEFIATNQAIAQVLKEGNSVAAKEEDGLTQIEIRTQTASDPVLSREQRKELKKALCRYVAENGIWISELEPQELECLAQLPGMKNLSAMAGFTRDLFEKRRGLIRDIGAQQVMLERQKDQMLRNGEMISGLERLRELETEFKKPIAPLVTAPQPPAQNFPSPSRAVAILNNMRKNIAFADVQLEGSDGTLKMHRSFLEELFFFSSRTLDHMREKQTTGIIKIDLSKTNIKTLTLFRDYQYAIELPQEISVDQLLELYELAHFFNHLELMGKVFALILSAVNDENQEFILPQVINHLISAPASIAYQYSGQVFDKLNIPVPLPENELFLFAVEQGLATAQNRLGRCYYRGEGVAQNFDKAFHFYRLAAEQKFVYAQYNLGLCYTRGHGVSKDPEKAVQFYRLAADQGDADAQLELGKCYMSGEGVAKDEGKGIQFVRSAADQGFINAQYMLAQCYDLGRGTDINQAEAIRFYQLTAAKGHAQARIALARLGLLNPF